MLNSKFQLWLLILVLTGIFMGGCATVPKKIAVSAKEEVFLKDLCDRYNVFCKWDGLTQVVTLRANDVQAKAILGSNIVLIEDERVVLNAPVRIIKSSILVPSDFKAKIIDRISKIKYRKESYAYKKVREIIIDAGHGGKDPGAIGRAGTKEKNVVLDISKRLKAILERQGFKVNMTRETDTFISLKKRTQIASGSKADLFVSIHANSSPSRGVHGIEVFSLKDLGYWEKNEAQLKENHRLVFRNLSMKNNYPELESIISDMLYTHKQAESKSLASSLAQKTASLVKTKNRGPKYARFYVLRNTLMTSILVEVGFLSNPKEERLLKTSAYRQNMAYALAKSILDYVKD